MSVTNSPSAGTDARNAPKGADDWMGLASVLQKHYGDKYQSAASYLRDLARGNVGRHTSLASLPWHEGTALGAFAAAGGHYEPHECVLAALSPSVPLRAVWRRLPRPHDS